MIFTLPKRTVSASPLKRLELRSQNARNDMIKQNVHSEYADYDSIEMRKSQLNIYEAQIIKTTIVIY